MKKLGLLLKEVSANRIKDSLKASNNVFIIKFSGLSSPDMTALRQELSGSGATLFVAKNSVVRRVFQDSQLESLVGAIEGPCGLVFTKREPVDATRALYNFSKSHEQLKLEGGALADRILTKVDIERLAKLPSKEVLRAQVVGALIAPISGLVYALSGNLKKLVYCLEQIKNKKPN